MMMLCKVVLLLISFVGLSSVGADTYRIPEPEIEVFYPRGFRVSIEDSPNVRLFAFHGNINNELRELEAGVYSKDVLHKRDGRWTFEDRRARLTIGDKIYYWLFVIRGHLGYRLDGGYYEVKELLPSPFEEASVRPPSPGQGQGQEQPSTEEPLPDICERRTTAAPPSPSQNSNSDTEQKICEQTVLNATQALISLTAQVEALRKHNQQLMTILSKYPDARQLTLSGRIPPSDDAGMTVRFILRERLDLNPDVTFARRNTDYNITFEVATIAEKIEILDVAKLKLKTSRIVIS